MPHKKDCDSRGELFFDPDDPKREYCVNCNEEVTLKDDPMYVQAKVLDEI